MRKAISKILVILLSLSLIGCGGDKDNSSNGQLNNGDNKPSVEENNDDNVEKDTAQEENKESNTEQTENNKPNNSQASNSKPNVKPSNNNNNNNKPSEKPSNENEEQTQSIKFTEAKALEIAMDKYGTDDDFKFKVEGFYKDNNKGYYKVVLNITDKRKVTEQNKGIYDILRVYEDGTILCRNGRLIKDTSQRIFDIKFTEIGAINTAIFRYGHDEDIEYVVGKAHNDKGQKYFDVTVKIINPNKITEENKGIYDELKVYENGTIFGRNGLVIKDEDMDWGEAIESNFSREAALSIAQQKYGFDNDFEYVLGNLHKDHNKLYYDVVLKITDPTKITKENEGIYDILRVASDGSILCRNGMIIV